MQGLHVFDRRAVVAVDLESLVHSDHFLRKGRDVQPRFWGYGRSLLWASVTSGHPPKRTKEKAVTDYPIYEPEVDPGTLLIDDNLREVTEVFMACHATHCVLTTSHD